MCVSYVHVKGFCPPSQGARFPCENTKIAVLYIYEVLRVKFAVIGRNVPFVLWDGGAHAAASGL